jgi:SAM-dependent methyltransferase
VDGTSPFVCPHCRGRLRGGVESWACLGCGTGFRAMRGIPDLRTAEDLFMPNDDDWAYAQQLDADYNRLDFRGLLGRYFDLATEIPADLRRRQVAHILGAPDRARRWVDALGLPEGAGPILDLGCGSGSFLAAVGPRGAKLCGVDIAMRWLVVARKRLDEAGLGHVPLACGCAERLPLRDRSMAGVVAGDVIEHVADQGATLAESHRVLAPGGRLFLASPNRFSLAPEPHVQVWGVGFLPRPWMAPYVRWRRGLDFRAIRTHGRRGWERLLRRSPFRSGTIRAPGLPPGDLAGFGRLKRLLARLYTRAVATRPGRWAALRVGPLFHVVCTRAGADPPPATPATRPRSRRPAARA